MDSADSDRNVYFTPMSDHLKRLRLAACGQWRSEYQVGRKSEHKGYFFEFTHALKNVGVEWLRAKGIWNRGDRDSSEDLGYRFPND